MELSWLKLKLSLSQPGLNSSWVMGVHL